MYFYMLQQQPNFGQASTKQSTMKILLVVHIITSYKA